MILETNDKKIIEQFEKERKELYEKLIKERFQIPTRSEEIQENSIT
jgi:ribosomal protein L29